MKYSIVGRRSATGVKLIGALVLAVVAGLAGCATTRAAGDADPEMALVLASVRAETTKQEDELLAYAPAEFLGRQAGHGVGGNVDVASSCGCADVDSSSSSGQGSSGVGTIDIDGWTTSTLKVHIKIVRLPE